MLSEVYILRKLSAIKSNVFTCKVLDIIAPYSIDTANSDPIDIVFIVMEYEGHDLNKLLSSKVLDPVFSEQHVLVLIYNMLCSLNFIHSAGLLHRDIKIDNILVDDKCSAKICDFGLARP